MCTLHVACLVWDAMNSFSNRCEFQGWLKSLHGGVIRQAVPLTVLQVSKLEHYCRDLESPWDRCLVGGALALYILQWEGIGWGSH